MNVPLLWRLVLAHVVADFPLQPDELIAAKKRVWGVAIHALLFGIAAAMTVGSCLDTKGMVPGLVGLAAFHGLVDWEKQRLNKRLGRDSVLLFLGDQAVHIASLLLFARFFRLSNIPAVAAYPPLALAVVAVWAVPILLEMANAQRSGEKPFPRNTPGAMGDKLGMLERVALFMAAFRMGWFLIAAIVVLPRLIMWAKGRKAGIVPLDWTLSIGLGLISQMVSR